MDKDKCRRRFGTPVAATKILALLLVLCLAECATGSCLSYGHSCWGAHGKRSGKPAAAPDWYITRLLRRISNADLNGVPQAADKNEDMNTIFQVEMPNDARSTTRLMSESNESPVDLLPSRNLEAKPMLDDDLLSKMKIWQIMRGSVEDK